MRQLRDEITIKISKSNIFQNDALLYGNVWWEEKDGRLYLLNTFRREFLVITDGAYVWTGFLHRDIRFDRFNFSTELMGYHFV